MLIKDLNLDFSPYAHQILPDGEYLSRVLKCEEITAYPPQYLRISFIVLDGEYQGRTFYHNFKINSDSEKQRNMQKNKLAKLLAYCGKLNDGSVEEIIGNDVIVTVGSYKNYNQALNFKKVESNQDLVDSEDLANSEDIPF